MGININIEVACQECGEILEAEYKRMPDAKYFPNQSTEAQIIVAPCKTCILSARDEIYDRM